MRQLISFRTIPLSVSDLPHVVGRALYFLSGVFFCFCVERTSLGLGIDRYDVHTYKGVIWWRLQITAKGLDIWVNIEKYEPQLYEQYVTAFMYALSSMFVLTKDPKKILRSYVEDPPINFNVLSAGAPWALSAGRFASLFPQDILRDDTGVPVLWSLYDQHNKLVRENHFDRHPIKYPRAPVVGLHTWGVSVPMGLLCDDVSQVHRDRCIAAGVMVRHKLYRSKLEAILVEQLR